jgi:hypothetical protein
VLLDLRRGEPTIPAQRASQAQALEAKVHRVAQETSASIAQLE